MKDVFYLMREKASLKLRFSIGASAAAEGGVSGLSRNTSWNITYTKVKITACSLRRLFKFEMVSFFESTKKNPVSKKAQADPRGIPRVKIEVAKARSLSENHLVTTMLIELIMKGAAHAWIVVPKRTGQN